MNVLVVFRHEINPFMTKKARKDAAARPRAGCVSKQEALLSERGIR